MDQANEPPEYVAKFGAVLRSTHPYLTIGLVLHLSRLRSAYLVGQALAQTYPTDAAWTTALNDQGFLELADEVAVVLQQIEDAVEFGGDATPETVQAAVHQHYQEAMLAVGDFALLIGVEGQELLNVLVGLERGRGGGSTS